MSIFRAAAIQMRSGHDIVKNVADLEKLVEEAVAQGALYIQTPEMTGCIHWDRAAVLANMRDEADDLVFQTASALAKKHKIYLHIGSTAIRQSADKVANRAVIFGPEGQKIATYDKIHMFDVDLDNGESWRESATYEPGDVSQVVELPFANIGMAICYDIRFPQLFRAQALAGANLITAPAAFTRQTGRAHWHVLQRARAIENGAFLVSAAQGGVHDDGRETFGHSIIVSPWGEVLAEASHDEPAVIVADIDIAQSAACRAKIPNLKNARDFSVNKISI